MSSFVCFSICENYCTLSIVYLRIVILSERKVTRGCPPLNAEALEVGLQAQQGFILCVPPHERKAVLMVHDLSIGTAFLFI